MELDKVLTVAIGRNNAQNVPMSDSQWDNFILRIGDIMESATTVVFAGYGNAIQSDCLHAGQHEESYAIIGINPTNVRELRADIASLIWSYDQTSAAFALDAAHEPVFDTVGGSRPIAPSATAAQYAPSHGGYPSA
jgi:hypothetical protein